ncbi:MarR family transcriptional regulator [Listeria rocourtiae]|uniref:MarR family winged helix-turn-helix transcriptional regulator n=1 Tax=Listeria rocourtiae TaxID=647910 RepID=UPI0016266F72|nr:MarR family transcriptional regulator [Listeria rocourtiae]MBC1603133.1 MarR family transcriptional regulator [Listeria rocourtiae]
MDDGCSERALLLAKMHQLCKNMNQTFEAKLQMSATKLELLYQVSCGHEQNQQALQHSLNLDAAAITRHLRKLEEDGLLIREKRAPDRRATFIRLTELGETRLTQLMAQKKVFQKQLLDGLTEQELLNFADILERMSMNSMRSF